MLTNFTNISVVAGAEADTTAQNETTEEINVLLVCIGNFKHINYVWWCLWCIGAERLAMNIYC